MVYELCDLGHIHHLVDSLEGPGREYTQGGNKKRTCQGLTSLRSEWQTYKCKHTKLEPYGYKR